MLTITPADLLTYARRMEGQELRTLYEQARFTVTFQGDTLIFTPQSSGKPRPHELKYLENVCNAFSQTNSLKPAEYRDGTYNASYTLTLIAKYLGAIADGTVDPRAERRHSGESISTGSD